MPGKLTDKFRDTIEFKWTDFITLEKNPHADNYDVVIATLVRACVGGNLRAIKESLDRMDGKVITEVEMEYPRFYILYPNAKSKVELPAGNVAPPVEEVVDTTVGASRSESEEELPAGSLRAVLDKMLEAKKVTVASILESVRLLDEGASEDEIGNPTVKAAMIAGLMQLVHKGRINAVIEVLDQIDGKVSEHIKMLGGDVRVMNFSSVAPAEAELNADGVYEVSSPIITNVWTKALEKNTKR